MYGRGWCVDAGACDACAVLRRANQKLVDEGRRVSWVAAFEDVRGIWERGYRIAEKRGRGTRWEKGASECVLFVHATDRSARLS